MVHSIEDIEGIGGSFANKLKAARIETIEALLKEGATRQGRKEIAAETGIDESKILRWVNMADLFRIKGVGEEYSDLLEAAGVDTVVELANRKPENLYSKMMEINKDKNLVRRIPSSEQVSEWINQAKALPRMVSH